MENDIHVQIPQLVWTTFFELQSLQITRPKLFLIETVVRFLIGFLKSLRLITKALYILVSKIVSYIKSVYTCKNMKCRQNILWYQWGITAIAFKHMVSLNIYLYIEHRMSPINFLYRVLKPSKSGVKLTPGGRLNKKDSLTRYGDSHVKDKTS